MKYFHFPFSELEYKHYLYTWCQQGCPQEAASKVWVFFQCRKQVQERCQFYNPHLQSLSWKRVHVVPVASFSSRYNHCHLNEGQRFESLSNRLPEIARSEGGSGGAVGGKEREKEREKEEGSNLRCCTSMFVRSGRKNSYF